MSDVLNHPAPEVRPIRRRSTRGSVGAQRSDVPSDLPVSTVTAAEEMVSMEMEPAVTPGNRRRSTRRSVSNRDNMADPLATTEQPAATPGNRRRRTRQSLCKTDSQLAVTKETVPDMQPAPVVMESVTKQQTLRRRSSRRSVAVATPRPAGIPEPIPEENAQTMKTAETSQPIESQEPKKNVYIDNQGRTHVSLL